MEELITVIVPIYNVEDFIDMCLESLSKQTYKHFEVLMVNDGSTDNSGIICKEYADRDSRFQYFEKENGGLSDARNFGLEHSKELTLHLSILMIGLVIRIFLIYMKH